MRQILVWIGVVAVFGVVTGGLVGMVAPAGASGLHGSPTQLFGVTNYMSDNWAGYFATGSADTVTKVTGAWTQPTVTCPPTGKAYDVFWVGIDGAGTSTVEQIGTLAECSGGAVSYHAWWELFPLNDIKIIKSVSVAPGDAVSASVTWSSTASKFVMKITVAGVSATRSGTQPGTDRETAECIVERPSGATSLYRLADFGSVTFDSCKATISSTTSAIQKFSTAGAITMIDGGGHTMASVSAATGPGSYTATWVRLS